MKKCGFSSVASENLLPKKSAHCAFRPQQVDYLRGECSGMPFGKFLASHETLLKGRLDVRPIRLVRHAEGSHDEGSVLRFRHFILHASHPRVGVGHVDTRTKLRFEGGSPDVCD